MTAVILFGVLISCMILGVPILFSIALSSLVTLLFTGQPITIIVQRMFATFEVFPFTAIFLFTLMGVILEKSGISKIILDFVEALLAKIPGGLGIAGVWSCALFGALTGSSPGTVAAIGSPLIPEMDARGYPSHFSSALISAAGALGQMIPPSICAITFGVVMNVSIGDLFGALIIPGIGLALLLSFMTYYISKKRGYKGSKNTYTTKEKRSLFFKALPAIILPIAVIGGIYFGIVTPTEAGAIGAVTSILLASTIYRQAKVGILNYLKDSFISASITTSVIMLIISASYALSYTFSIERIPQAIADSLLQATQSPLMILLVFNLLMLFLGMFIEGNAMIVMLAPLISSLFIPLNISLIMVGVLIVFNAMIGCITPPLGVNLYVATAVGNVKFERISKEIIPFVIGEGFLLIFYILIVILQL